MTSLYIRIDSHRGKPMSWPFVGGWMEILSFVRSIDFFLLFHCTFHWFSSLPDNQKKKEKKRQKKNGPHVRLVCVDLLFHQSLFFLVLFVCVELLWIPETLGHLSAGRFFFIDGSLAFHGSAWLVSRCRGRRCLGRHLFFLSTHLIFTEFYRVWLGFIGFYWVLLGFTGFYWVLPSFSGFYWVSLGFTGFFRVLLGFTGFDWVFTEFDLDLLGFYWVSLDCTEFYCGWLSFPRFFIKRDDCFYGHYWVLPSFTGLDRVLPGFTEFYRLSLGFTEFYWVLLGFTGFFWIFLDMTVIY